MTLSTVAPCTHSICTTPSDINVAVCHGGMQSASLCDPVLQLSALFVKRPSVGLATDNPSISLKTLLTFLKKLPKGLREILPTTHAALTLALDSCSDRYGWSTETLGTMHGSTARGSTAHRPCLTLPETVGLLWDIFASVIARWGIELAHPRKRDRRDYARTKSHVATDEGRRHTCRLFVKLIADALPDGGLSDISPCTIDELVAVVDDCCGMALGVQTDRALLYALLSPVCLCVSDPSVFIAKTVVRSMLMHEILGSVLSSHLCVHMHQTQFGLDVPDVQLRGIAQELVNTKQMLTTLKTDVDCGRPLDVTIVGRNLVMGSTLRTRPSKHAVGNDDLKTACVEWALNSKVAFRNAPATLVEATDVIRIRVALGA